MVDDTLAASVAEHPEMAGVLFIAVLLRSRARAATTRNTAYAGP
jgi:hypothetical protein